MRATTAFAIATTDERGQVWFLVRPLAIHGSMIRTADPFHALTFGTVADAEHWVDSLRDEWKQQLDGRAIEIRELTCEIGQAWKTYKVGYMEAEPAKEEIGEPERPRPASRPVEPEPEPEPEAFELTDAPRPKKRAAKRAPRKEVASASAHGPVSSGTATAVLEHDQVEDDDTPDFDLKPLAGSKASPMAGFQPSEQQERFLSALRDSDAHVLLEARAGSGKSTTCRAGAWELHSRKQRSVYVCFNKAIAQEFQQDLPPSCRAATLHSMGFSLLKDSIGAAELDVDKIDRLLDPYFDRRRQRAERSAAAKLVGLCRNLLIDDTSPGSLVELAADFDVELPRFTTEEVLVVVPEILKACLEQPSLVDFDDMIWLPVKLGLVASRSPDVLFVDEAQDLNACQHALVDVLCPDGRMVVVGDRYQSIYGFRGADCESIPNFEAKLATSDRDLESYPLTVTRRCPRRHVEMARRIVPSFDHLPSAPEGVVTVADAERWHEHVAPGDLVLCRTNAPLISACYRLIRAGERATVRGRDIGKGLQMLLLRLRATNVADLMRRLGDYRAQEVEKIQQLRNPEPKLAMLNDKVDCLVALCDGAATVEEVRERADTLFTDVQDDSAVQLSSVHRAKGLERPRVVILRPDLLPGPWAVRPEDVQQERNLTYVAATRAREELVFAGLVPPLLLQA